MVHDHTIMSLSVFVFVNIGVFAREFFPLKNICFINKLAILRLDNLLTQYKIETSLDRRFVLISSTLTKSVPFLVNLMQKLVNYLRFFVFVARRTVVFASLVTRFLLKMVYSITVTLVINNSCNTCLSFLTFWILKLYSFSLSLASLGFRPQPNFL